MMNFGELDSDIWISYDVVKKTRPDVRVFAAEKRHVSVGADQKVFLIGCRVVFRVLSVLVYSIGSRNTRITIVCRFCGRTSQGNYLSILRLFVIFAILFANSDVIALLSLIKYCMREMISHFAILHRVGIAKALGSTQFFILESTTARLKMWL